LDDLLAFQFLAWPPYSMKSHLSTWKKKHKRVQYIQYIRFINIYLINIKINCNCIRPDKRKPYWIWSLFCWLFIYFESFTWKSVRIVFSFCDCFPPDSVLLFMIGLVIFCVRQSLGKVEIAIILPLTEQQVVDRVYNIKFLPPSLSAYEFRYFLFKKFALFQI
jgi:hypothetical protein